MIRKCIGYKYSYCDKNCVANNIYCDDCEKKKVDETKMLMAELDMYTKILERMTKKDNPQGQYCGCDVHLDECVRFKCNCLCHKN